MSDNKNMKTTQILNIALASLLLVACGKPMQETKAIKQDVTETIFASGILQANDTYNLTSQVDGYLVQLNFNEGDIVKKGQVLAVVDNKQNQFNSKSASALYEISKSNLQPNAPSIVQAKNSMWVGKQKMEKDSTQAARFSLLLESNSVSRSDYENATLQYQTSKANYANSVENFKLIKQQAKQQDIINEAQKNVSNNLSGNNEISAVFVGKIYIKYKQKGDYVRKGDIIATIGDPNLIYAKISVDESSIDKIKIGQEAIISINPQKGKKYKGKVAEILPAFDESRQSFTCKLFFVDSLDFKLINTQLQSNIIIGETRNALLIPRIYLKHGDYVDVKGKKEPVKVTTRLISSEWVLIENGITENDVLTTEKIAGLDANHLK